MKLAASVLAMDLLLVAVSAAGRSFGIATIEGTNAPLGATSHPDIKCILYEVPNVDGLVRGELTVSGEQVPCTIDFNLVNDAKLLFRARIDHDSRGMERTNDYKYTADDSKRYYSFDIRREHLNQSAIVIMGNTKWLRLDLRSVHVDRRPPQVHVTKEGGTLQSICKDYEVSDVLVIKVNNLTNSAVTVGSHLTIPVND